MTQLLDSPEPEVYQGQFGEYTITDSDRAGVLAYRISLMVAALTFAIGVGLALWQGNNPTVQQALTPLYICFSLVLGLSLATIHIYLALLHRLLQLFWGIGGIAALVLATQNSEPLALTIYNQPQTLFGLGFTFAALAGIYFKEAFCFNRLETKFLTPLVPFLLLGHIAGVLSIYQEQFLLTVWAFLFLVFASRKFFQPIPQDIGDKSVFEHLKSQH
ncbi:MAG: DUF2301 domain-containing membrane protein [Actinomycetota bacterium]